MKLYIILFITITLLFLIMSFNCNSSGKISYDSIISIFDSTDFTSLKNRVIYKRSTGARLGSSIYFINTVLDNCSPYCVVVDNYTDSIIEIKKELVFKSCGKDYLTENEIKECLVYFIKLNLFYIKVDNDGNIYFSLNFMSEPNILRKSKNSTPKDLNKYTHYKGDWYIINP